jgi:hypothetical protein
MAPINFLAFRPLFFGIGNTIRQQVSGHLLDEILGLLYCHLPNPKKG